MKLAVKQKAADDAGGGVCKPVSDGSGGIFDAPGAGTRGLHSSTSQLNLRIFGTHRSR